MGLRYLIFMGRNSKNKKKLSLVRIMNSVNMNTKDVVNNVRIFNIFVAMNSNRRE